LICAGFCPSHGWLYVKQAETERFSLSPAALPLCLASCALSLLTAASVFLVSSLLTTG